ncbi:DUF4406 domain-containing protein [Citrobacter freundii]|nr:DUF4406 domain-containing protein [Citrobacter freundii]
MTLLVLGTYRVPLPPEVVKQPGSHFLFPAHTYQHADAIFILNGWKGSDGAVAEYHLAFKLGLKIMTQNSVTTHNKEVSTQ